MADGPMGAVNVTLRYPNRFILPWNTFPPSFKSDADALLARLAAGDPRGTGFVRPARPLTVSAYQLHIREVASALVHRGYDPKSIRSLGDLVEAKAVTAWVKFFQDRQTGPSVARVHHLITRFNTIARHWLGVERPHLNRLKKIARYFSHRERGPRARDRGRLRPFDDSANVRALFALPETIVKNVIDKDTGTPKWARRVMIAVAIELLLLGPIRIGLFPDLRLDRHIKIGKGNSKVRIFISANEARRRSDLTFVLPASSAQLLRLYLKRYRPRLTNNPSGWLFPHMGNTPITRQGFGWAIRHTVLNTIGLRVHAHLIRQIGVKLFLERNPDGLEIVRQVMGFSSTKDVARAYGGFLVPAMARRFDDNVLKVWRRGQRYGRT